MLICKLSLLPFTLWLLCGLAWAQEPITLESGKPIEQEIAGGQTHVYQISLTTGQFVRFRLVQHTIDASLSLTTPGGKQVVEIDLNGSGEAESLSLEAMATGSYWLTVRGGGVAALRGSYGLAALVQPTVTAQDRKRLVGEAVLIEANELRKQAGKTAQQVIEKLQQAVPIWRELEEPSWTAWSLRRIGIAYSVLS